MYSTSFLLKLNELYQFQQKNRVSWYRGLSDHRFELLSGLFRTEYDEFDEYLEAECSLYNMFLNYGHSLHNYKDWELLYLMQHHGVSTRLLDWTESFSVALFFAFKNWNPEQTACTVWLLNPIRLNDNFNRNFGFFMPKETEAYEKMLYPEEGSMIKFPDCSVALFPRRNNNRLIAQQGTFTLQGNTRLPLDQEHKGELVNDNILLRIDFTKDNYYDIKAYLQVNGINNFSVFPDLDGLARYILEEHKRLIKVIR